jgi:23S rRNA (pseudouridine1915-N3)-methyltransferase
MLVSIVAVGRLKAGPERELVARYLERAVAGGRALGLTGFSISEHAESRAAAAAQRRREEGTAISSALPPQGVTVALDERGKLIDSAALAERIAGWRDAGRPAAAFVIGGADGLDPGLRDKAELALSFSPLTWPHQLVRIMLAEQLYRTTTILSGHPYHRGG